LPVSISVYLNQADYFYLAPAPDTFMTETKSIPVVMTFAGNDPTGGAGIQADIETLASIGCHAAPVITANTIQDTHDVIDYEPVDTGLLIAQARAVLEDMPVAAFKIGLIGSVANVEAIHTLLKDYPDRPVVLDPVLSSNAGSELSDEAIRDAMVTLLLPLTKVVTPNSVEARILAPEGDTLDACAQQLLSLECEYVLITGTHENTPEVINTLYANQQRLESFRWERLPGSYHGSGCTLSSAIAGLLAQGIDPFNAVHEAQEYTWESLKHGYRPGMGQLIPDRLYWSRRDDE